MIASFAQPYQLKYFSGCLVKFSRAVQQDVTANDIPEWGVAAEAPDASIPNGHMMAAAPELLNALLIAKRYADQAKLKLLGEVAGYSDALFEKVQKDFIWIKQMADCDAIDAAIAKATGAQP